MQELSLSIGEVAARSGAAPSAIRFYEQVGLIASERSQSKQRRFAREVLRRIAFIRAAQQVGLTLDEIRAALATLPDERTPTKADWARLASAWRPRLDEQIALLTRLRDKLTSCIGCGCLSFKACALYNPGDIVAGRGAGARYLLGDRPASPEARAPRAGKPPRAGRIAGRHRPRDS
jgi:MerR family redox-sensitive transcriptional activator SoxR